MSKDRLVTVYITNHNYGKYLQQSIESVLSQTYQNYELIIIDDGSTDNSKKIIEKYEDHPKVEVVFQKRKGLTVSNNIALKLAMGEFVLRLDADDYLDKSALKILIDEFDDEMVGIVFGDWYVIDDKGVVLEIQRRHDFNSEVTMFDQPAHGACTMFRKKCLEELSGYDESVSMQDGFEVWLKLIKHYRVKNINLPVFYYRQHGTNLTRDKSELLNARSKVLKNFAENNGIVQPKVVAILPVRGSIVDSRSQPFLTIQNRYLIDWSLDGLAETGAIDKVIVTSSDESVLAHVKENYGKNKFYTLKRPIELARINTHVEETVIHVFDSFDIVGNYDYFLAFSIETPFIRKELIESAISAIQIFHTDTVIGAVQEDRFFYVHQGKGMKLINSSSKLLRLEKEQWYAGVKGFQLRNIDHFLKTKNLIGDNIGHIIFDKKAAFIIEDELDVKVAEALLNG